MKHLGPIQQKIEDGMCIACHGVMDYSQKVAKCKICGLEVRNEDARQNKDGGDNGLLGSAFRFSN